MDSEINVSVGPEVQSLPFLKLLAELRNCVYEEFLLMSDFNTVSLEKPVHAHSSSSATVTYLSWPQTGKCASKLRRYFLRICPISQMVSDACNVWLGI